MESSKAAPAGSPAGSPAGWGQRGPGRALTGRALTGRVEGPWLAAVRPLFVHSARERSLFVPRGHTYVPMHGAGTAEGWQ